MVVLVLLVFAGFVKIHMLGKMCKKPGPWWPVSNCEPTKNSSYKQSTICEFALFLFWFLQKTLAKLVAASVGQTSSDFDVIS